MPKSFVDVLIRCVVEHPNDMDAGDVIAENNYSIDRAESTEMLECVTSGACNEEGVLVRKEDGGTGRSAEIVHHPNL